jgi:uncharacterized protein YkwD
MLSYIRRFVKARPALALALIAALALGTLTTAAALASPPGEPISTIEQELVNAVNAERTKRGLNPLIVNYSLMEAAWNHSVHMGKVGQLAHQGIGDGTPRDRINATGYKWITYGENVAVGYPNVQAVMTAWMNSPGHRANILNPKFTDIGVAHVVDGKHWWTQVFGKPVPPPDYVTVTPPAGHGRPCELKGDFDYDGKVTREDVDVVAQKFMLQEGDPDWDARFDLVSDGVINVYDVYEVARGIGNTCP